MQCPIKSHNYLVILKLVRIPEEVKIMLNKRVLTILSVLMLVASFAIVARAQEAPYRLNDKQVKRLMAQLKKDTGRFRKSLDSSLDRSRLNGSNREDDINRFMKTMKTRLSGCIAGSKTTSLWAPTWKLFWTAPMKSISS